MKGAHFRKRPVWRWLMEPVYLLGKPVTRFDRFCDDVLFVIVVMFIAALTTNLAVALLMYGLAIWG